MRLLVKGRDELYRTAARHIADAAEAALDLHGGFYIALSGGTTPRPLYKLLAQEYQKAIPWDRTHIFMGDERCVPPDDPQSNFGMIDQLLLSKLNIPEQNIHRIKGELPPDEAAAEYAEEIARVFRLKPHAVPRFDLILLGMGADGHVASIFPESEVINEVGKTVAAVCVPALTAYRVTLTPPVLKRASRVLVLVAGREKAFALRSVMEGPYEPRHVPAQLLKDAKGDVTWLVDFEAVEMLASAAG